MRHTAGQLADRLDALCLAELLFQEDRFLLGVEATDLTDERGTSGIGKERLR